MISRDSTDALVSRGETQTHIQTHSYNNVFDRSYPTHPRLSRCIQPNLIHTAIQITAFVKNIQLL